MASSPQPSGQANPSARTPPRKRVRLLYERRISLYALFVALPGIRGRRHSDLASVLDCGNRNSRSHSSELFAWWVLAMALHEQTDRPLQTLANVVASLREEDYSFRARGAVPDDALGELSLEVNALADLLADRRIQRHRSHRLACAAWSKRSMRRCLPSIPTECFAPGESRRRAPAAASRRFAARAHRRRNWAWPIACGRDETLVAFARQQSERALAGAAKLVPPESGVPHTLDRPVGCEPRAARRRAQRLAATDPRTGPRTQQFACSDQVDRRQPECAPPRRLA